MEAFFVSINTAAVVIIVAQQLAAQRVSASFTSSLFGTPQQFATLLYLPLAIVAFQCEPLYKLPGINKLTTFSTCRSKMTIAY